MIAAMWLGLGAALALAIWAAAQVLKRAFPRVYRVIDIASWTVELAFIAAAVLGAAYKLLFASG